jgi:DNA-binding CsgD family transcriptional regulator
VPPIRRSPTAHIVLYGTAIAALALLLDWLDFRHAMHRTSTGFYVVCVALFFAALGAWLAHRLTPRARRVGFARNAAAIAALGVSPRELEVLDQLASGAANKVIARRLGISPNTVKTHVARLLDKLEASTRTEAIAKARALDLLP